MFGLEDPVRETGFAAGRAAYGIVSVFTPRHLAFLTVTDLRKVIALGSPTGAYRAATEAAVRKVGAELSITRESAKALADVEQLAAFCVLVDMSALGAEHFCRKARANERLRRVPIIALSRNPSELS